MRWVVAGLGNPGEQYSRSGHNIGFMSSIAWPKNAARGWIAASSRESPARPG